jgi:hypothetical protein
MCQHQGAKPYVFSQCLWSMKASAQPIVHTCILPCADSGVSQGLAAVWCQNASSSSCLQGWFQSRGGAWSVESKGQKQEGFESRQHKYLNLTDKE